MTRIYSILIPTNNPLLCGIDNEETLNSHVSGTFQTDDVVSFSTYCLEYILCNNYNIVSLNCEQRLNSASINESIEI